MKIPKWVFPNRVLEGHALETGILKANTTLVARHMRQGKDGQYYEIVENRRIRHDKSVTNAFVNDIVDCLTANTTTLGLFDDYKYHDSGISTEDESATFTDIQTEGETTRTTGTQVESTSTNIYKSVATHTYSATLAITEHGLFNAATAGVMMDRTEFAAINVVATDQIQFTFTIEFSSGG